MRHVAKYLGAATMVAALCLAPSSASAERAGRDAAAVRQAEETAERLRAELARVNVEVAALKRRARTVRNDYRLRERMADAEALAQKLTAAEAALSRQTSGRGEAAPSGAPIMAPPQASPQDGSVELEAKADLLSDQARKLVGEADALAKAAAEVRNRRSMRRKAGSWDRDPFAGLETSRRNVLVAAPSVKLSPASSSSGTKPADSSTQGGTITNSPTAEYGPAGGTASSDNPAPVVAPSAPSPTETSGRGAFGAAPSSTDGTSAAKSSPQPQLTSTDRQSVEQRLYLDPATAAELRQALGSGSGALAPEALDRGAAALRARARVLAAQAKALRARSLAP